MYVMCNDGGFSKKAHSSHVSKLLSATDPSRSGHTQLDLASALNQRLFVYELLASGMPVASLDSADFYDAKVCYLHILTQGLGLILSLRRFFHLSMNKEEESAREIKCQS